MVIMEAVEVETLMTMMMLIQILIVADRPEYIRHLAPAGTTT